MKKELNIFIIVVMVLIFVALKLTGNVTLDIQESYALGEELSGSVIFVIEDGDLIDKNEELSLELKSDSYFTASIFTVKEFIDGEIEPVEINGSYYYNISGSYSREIDDLIDYTFSEPGEYELYFLMEGYNLSAKKVIDVRESYGISTWSDDEEESDDDEVEVDDDDDDEGEECFVAVDLSENLSSGIFWNISSLPTENNSAEGNNGLGNTSFFVEVIVEGGSASVSLRANGDLISGGGDVIGLGNESYSVNLSDANVPSSEKIKLTTSPVNIGENLSNGSIMYLKFFLDIPGGQPAGTYNNSLLFNAVCEADDDDE